MMQTTALNRVAPFTGAQVRAQRPVARRPLRFAARADGGRVEGGSKGEGRAAPMSENKQAQNNVENMAAPDGDRALEGEKAQLSGNAQGVQDYDKQPSGGKGAESTTPAGESSSSGVANDKSEAAKGTH